MFYHNSASFFIDFINFLIIAVQYALIPFAAYQLVIAVFGFRKRREESADKYAPVNRFALIVAAHDESAVVGNIVRNLQKIEYPKEMYD
ncbi:MAG: hypothetical protein N2Z60_08190, partial [Elusimicrobiales bacterium]|nr:hypothetical protein [Elusimicrobiales bacterium]